ncbi:peroxisomal and mitochondrial division factor 2-like [Nicotiana sylvestris]|uniref:peroxisomal and mitochondrial division factor 2-like n=1 Tax=Nicotiana sylvestris TaxID=4096 RepID=UPI00388C699A
MVEDYESESDIDPEDMRIFEEGFTRTVEVNGSGLSRGIAAMALRIKSSRRAETRAESFLKMAKKYRHELEKLLHAKDEELEVGKGVVAECEDLQAKGLSLRAELEQTAARVDTLSADWTEKVAELEKKVAEMERAEDARLSALARAAALEDIIGILKFEHESERVKTTLREARLKERIGEIYREASSLEDRVATLEAEKAQLLGLWEAGSVPEAAFEDAQAKAREARISFGYNPATLEASEGVEVEDGLSDDEDAGENGGGDDDE